MSAKRSFAVEAHSDASPETVFEVLADIPRWHEWAGPMIRQSTRDRDGSPDPNGVGAVRRLGSRPYFSREEIVELSPPHRLVYTLLSGMPVRDYRSEVDLRPGPDGRGTTISWRSTFHPKVPGTGWLLNRFMNWIIAGVASRLGSAASTHH